MSSFLSPDKIKYNKRGINSKDAPELRRRFGSNDFTAKPRKTFFRQYLSAFGDPIIKILLIALALNIIISIHNMDIYEPLGIAIALFLATFVSTLSEYGSESAFLKLQEQSGSSFYRVMRDNKLCSVNISDIVVGDTVILSSGERVPADGILFYGKVSVDQSALNGETREEEKYPSPCSKDWELSCKCQLFRGSVITNGECEMTVGRTGDTTFYGSVASEIQSASAKSPLQERLSVLAGILSKIGYIAAGLVFFADLFNCLLMDNGFVMSSVIAELSDTSQMITNLLHALTLAITVVVVAVPEGLPMMITVVLSSNMHRLKRDNVLVRRLVGIETGGSINILFCDKTGTLTHGTLSVTGFFAPDGKCYTRLPQQYKETVRRCILLSNESSFTDGKAAGGNATDKALLNFADKGFFIKAEKRIAFDSRKKYAAALYDKIWYVKGAPEVLFNKCREVPSKILECHNRLSEQGARVIALATGEDMNELRIVGLIALSDKLRASARESVRVMQKAGIHICMVTGDNAQTASCIAQACGIMQKDGIVITGERLSALSDAEVIKMLPRLCVVARALPSDKSRLVRLCGSAGLVCAMTGDGINDAPALKQADVGFAMGSGTEVAKQAGDIVVLDDNVSSIAKAILYGRTIFKSIRKFIVFQLTMNLCAVGISIIGPFIGVDTPVTVMQMLWINIIMDTLAGLAFAGAPPFIRYMQEKPLPRKEPVLSRAMAVQIMMMGGYNLAVCTAFLTLEFFKTRFGYYESSLQFMTAFFALFIFSGVFAAVSAASDGANFIRSLVCNKTFAVIFAAIIAVSLWIIYFGGTMFRTVPITSLRLICVFAFSAGVLIFETLRKSIFKKH